MPKKTKQERKDQENCIETTPKVSRRTIKVPEYEPVRAVGYENNANAKSILKNKSSVAVLQDAKQKAKLRLEE